MKKQVQELIKTGVGMKIGKIGFEEISMVSGGNVNINGGLQRTKRPDAEILTYLISHYTAFENCLGTIRLENKWEQFCFSDSKPEKCPNVIWDLLHDLGSRLIPECTDIK